MYRKLFLAIGLTVLFGSISTFAASCSRQTKNEETQEIKKDSIAENNSIENPELAIPLPQIPLSLTNPHDRASFFIKHYWDEFNFSDLSYLNNEKSLEASIANFLGVATSLPLNEVKPSLLLPLEKSSEEMFDFFIKIYKKYLYNPNSPLLNEEYYIPAVEYIRKSPKVSYAERVRLEDLYKLMLRNRVGKKAEDFIYEEMDGSLHHLNTQHSPYTILVFYEPECHSCSNLIEQLHYDEQLQNLVSTQKLSILFIYPDNNKELWKSSLSDFPDFVKVGINKDGSIINQQLYDIKATPTLYLLDNRTNVILKDARIEVIKEYLSQH